MKVIKKYCLLLFALVGVENISAQNIDTLYIVPENPTNTEDVIFISHVSGNGIALDTSYWQISNNNIYVTMKFYETGLTVVHTVTDSINFGNFPSGNYTVYFSDTIFKTDIATSVDADTLFFDVNTNSIENTNYEFIKAFPNPISNGFIYIDSKRKLTPISKIEIINNQGLVVLKTNKNKILVDTLPSGIFILKVYYIDSVIAKKIIKI